MPVQLSTILYISDYREKSSSEFFIRLATGHTRLDNLGSVQMFYITTFYPVDEEKPCYVPRFKEGQILSVANSKFSNRTTGTTDQLDLILTSATILNIKPEDQPIHPINIVGTAIASNLPVSTDIGIQLECIISDYLTKEKPTETSIVLFVPHGGRLTNQLASTKRGSSIFFSGSLTLIEGHLYLELHNFSFNRNQSVPSPTKEKMPWSNTSESTQISTSTNKAQAIHKKTQEKQLILLPEKRQAQSNSN